MIHDVCGLVVVWEIDVVRDDGIGRFMRMAAYKS